MAQHIARWYIDRVVEAENDGMDAREERLIGTWLRSAEDEGGTEGAPEDGAGDGAGGGGAAQVYRPFTYDFPRARAPRSRLVFAAGGGLEVSGPAPADAPSSLPGRWLLGGDALVLESAPLGGRFRFSVDADRLVLQPEQTQPE